MADLWRRASAALSRVPPSLLMVASAFLFATMGVCVKLASAHYGAGEIVMYRSLVGTLTLGGLILAQGGTLRTSVPGMHFWRVLVGASSLCMWFYALSGLPLATAMTLNYMSSVWMVLFLIGGAVMVGGAKIDARLVVTVLIGFAGVACILRPTIGRDQLWYGVVGLLSGMLAALAYLQVTALGRVGEPGTRVVFYFSLGGIVAGAALMAVSGGPSPHSWIGLLELLAVGLLATSAQVFLTRAYAVGRPLVNASLQYLGIAFAFAWGVLIFDDPVTLLALSGMVLVVVAGIAASRLRQTVAPSQDSTFES